MDVDETDRRLIEALLADGRADTAELASATGLAPQIVDERVNRMEERGVITGYEPRIDYGELGYDVTAVLRVGVDWNAGDEPLGSLYEDDQLVSVYEVTGEDDAIAVGKFEGVTELRARVGEWLTAEGITDVASTIVLETAKEHVSFPPAVDAR